MAIISEGKSDIKIKKIAKNKKKVNTSSAEKHKEKIVAYLKAIKKNYEDAAAAYQVMLDKGGADDDDTNTKLDVTTTTGKDIKAYHDKLAARASYCNVRINDVETAWAEASNTETAYLSKRLAEAEKQIAELKKLANNDTDQN